MDISLGECLKRLRAERGLSLEGIAQRTRIHLSYLEALEENDFTKLPPAPVFAKAYLKAYSRCLTLSPDQEADVLLRFDSLASGYYRAVASAGQWTEAAGYAGATGVAGSKPSLARVRLFR
jgi:transcriptional regulator with XRE-family HTH domain